MVRSVLLFAILVAVASALDEKAVVVDPKTAVSTDRGSDVTERRVVDGVLSMLGVPTDSLKSYDKTPDEEAEAGSKKDNPGERGIHKKKYWHLALYHALYWWAWAFAVVVVKFKVALLVILGHLTYFVVALIRMLLREVPLWIQLKRDPAPVYGPPPPQYGPQYAAQAQYGTYGTYAPSPYKRRAGAATGAAEAAPAGSSTHDLAYAAHAAHARRK